MGLNIPFSFALVTSRHERSISGWRIILGQCWGRRARCQRQTARQRNNENAKGTHCFYPRHRPRRGPFWEPAAVVRPPYGNGLDEHGKHIKGTKLRILTTCVLLVTLSWPSPSQWSQ